MPTLNYKVAYVKINYMPLLIYTVK